MYVPVVPFMIYAEGVEGNVIVPPLAVKDITPSVQTEGNPCTTVILLGYKFIDTVTVAVVVQPLASVPVTV